MYVILLIYIMHANLYKTDCIMLYITITYSRLYVGVYSRVTCDCDEPRPWPWVRERKFEQVVFIGYKYSEYILSLRHKPVVFRKCHRLSSVSVLVGSSSIRSRKQNGSEEMCTAFTLDKLYVRFGNWHE